MWPVSVTRQLPLSLAVLTLVAGAAVAQMNRPHMRQHSDKSAKGTSIDDAAKQLSSDDPDKRLDAVKALGISKNSKATEYLIKAVGDLDVRVQAKAIQILGDVRASESTPTLLQCLIVRTTDASTEQLILASLGKIGDARAVQPVIELLQRDLDAATRGAAVFALGEIGAPEAVGVLEHIAQTDEDQAVRRVATEAESKIEAHHGLIRGDMTDPSAAFLNPNEPPPAQQGHRRQH